jgi:hypothetical protein
MVRTKPRTLAFAFVGLLLTACSPSAADHASAVPPTVTETPSAAGTQSPDVQPAPTATATPQPSASLRLETTPPSATASVAPSPGDVIALAEAQPPFGGWSPDSMHFLARATDGRIGIFDRTGTKVAAIDAQYGDWTSANEVGVFGTPGPGRAIGHVSYFDIDGTKLSDVSAEFESALFAPNSEVFAGESLASGDQAFGTSYRVWDGSTMSGLRDGVPQGWSPDGSQLVVLMPLGPGNGPPGEEGTPKLVDRSGKALFALPGWVGDARDVYQFSPDGRYFAACLSGHGETQGMRVVDVQAQTVAPSVGRCFYSSWTADDKLYVSTPGVAPAVWSPTGGITATLLSPGTYVMPSPDGRLATWTDDSLHIEGQAAASDYRASAGTIIWVDWSPDGSALMVTTGSDLTLITPGT